MATKYSVYNILPHLENHPICNSEPCNKAGYAREYNAPVDLNPFCAQQNKIFRDFQLKQGTDESKRLKNLSQSNSNQFNYK